MSEHRKPTGRPLYPVLPLCRLLGISPQGYYKHQDSYLEEPVLQTSIILYCQHLRTLLPQCGCRELLALCQDYFQEKFTIGRDSFYSLLRANNLMLRKRYYRPRTTDSKHGLRLYPDLLNTTPKLQVKQHGELVVGDITYLRTMDGFAFLSLLTDAYSRMIVGYALHPTLEKEGPLKALEMCIKHYQSMGVKLEHLIHHTDRGCQYASNEYTHILHQHHIKISMTQSGDPLHNALAERMNNTIKNSWHVESTDYSFQDAQKAVDNAVKLYNTFRPHSALGMIPPQDFLQSCL